MSGDCSAKSSLTSTDYLCGLPSGSCTGQMGTTSASPTQTAPTSASSSATRKAPLVRLQPRRRLLVTRQESTPLYIFLCFAGLSIDFDAEQLYWISSGNGTINRCKLDGSELEVLEGAKGKLIKATALAIMGTTRENIHF